MWEKLSFVTRNEWRRCKTTFETPEADVKFHSKRVKKCKIALWTREKDVRRLETFSVNIHVAVHVADATYSVTPELAIDYLPSG